MQYPALTWITDDPAFGHLKRVSKILFDCLRFAARISWIVSRIVARNRRTLFGRTKDMSNPAGTTDAITQFPGLSIYEQTAISRTVTDRQQVVWWLVCQCLKFNIATWTTIFRSNLPVWYRTFWRPPRTGNQGTELKLNKLINVKRVFSCASLLRRDVSRIAERNTEAEHIWGFVLSHIYSDIYSEYKENVEWLNYLFDRTGGHLKSAMK